MKKLSITEKAQAYDKAIKEASIAYKDEDKHLKATLERIFPELKESEDDEMIKWIIDDIRYNMDNEPLNNSEYKKKAEKAIAWLEKQGEKPQGKSAREALNEEKVDNQNCVKLTGEAELKFKV